MCFRQEVDTIDGRERVQHSAHPTPAVIIAGGRRPHEEERADIMGQVIVDPQELRRFASRLRFFSTEVMTQMQGVQRQLAALSSTWRDQEQQKFTEEFEQQLSTFARFVELTEDYVPFLIRKAERVEEYQQQR
jgi:uncharacterized protein YukE